MGAVVACVAGASTTSAPLFQVRPPSVLKLVEATPEALSEAAKATVTARLCQRLSAPV